MTNFNSILYAINLVLFIFQLGVFWIHEINYRTTQTKLDIHQKQSNSIPKDDHIIQSSKYEIQRYERCTGHEIHTTSFECLLPGKITVILTVYRRKHLYEQLMAACRQTLTPHEIIVLQNEHHMEIMSTIEQVKKQFNSIIIHTITTTKNMKFHGRFLLPFLIQTDYTSIWDDDIVPGTKWLERAVNTSRATGNSLVGANGRNIYKISNFNTIQHNVGDICPIAEQQVDFVGHSWIFPTDFIQVLWKFRWLTFETGEDMQFAFALQQHGIKSYVAKQENNDVCAHKKNYGSDSVASYKKYDRNYPIRMWLLLALLRSGFKTLYCINCEDNTIRKQEETLWLLVAKAKNITSLLPSHNAVFSTKKYKQIVFSRNVYTQKALNHSKYKIVVIIGTRPEAIKLAPVIRALQNDARFNVLTLVTSQQEDLIDTFLKLFNIDIDVLIPNIMKKEQGLSLLTAKLITAISQALQQVLPSLIVVQGDTTSALAAAIAGFYSGIPIAHVEAGLRTYNLHAPMPEEFNRRVISLLSSIHFTPSNTSKTNLLGEGIASSSIFVTGNPGIDAVLELKKSIQYGSVEQKIKRIGLWSLLNPKPDMLKNSQVRVILFTCHRRENIGSSTDEIFSAMSALLSESQKKEIVDPITNLPLEVHVIYPVHPNALGKKALMFFEKNPRMHLIKPVDFAVMSFILEHVAFVVTDSGGLQEEASIYQKPLLVLRNSTERPESLQAGISVLVGSDRMLILQYAKRLLTNSQFYLNMSKETWPYGDGKSAKRIAEIIAKLNTKHLN